MEKITIDQIAKMAYVSRSVVSRVLNNRPNVSDESRERVLRVIEAYNYTPNATARSLATHRSFEICILAPRKPDDVFANAFWSLLFLGISEQALKRGYFVSLSMVADEMEGKMNQRVFCGPLFDGYILISRTVLDQLLAAIRQRRIPVVQIGSTPDYEDVPSVDIDNISGACAATEHLIGLGHRNIAAIMGALYNMESIDRLEGYKKALVRHGLPLEDDMVGVGNYSHKSGYDAMATLLTRTPRPDAVFCANDAMAAGALLAISEAGLSVPHDVAVVGYDNLPGSAYTIPPLTTISQPIHRMGERAADLLIDRIEEVNLDVAHEKLDACLIIRKTCGAAL